MSRRVFFPYKNHHEMQFDILFKVHEYQGTLMCLIILLVINLVSTTLKKYFYEYVADFLE